MPQRFGSFWCNQLAVVPKERCAFGVSKFQGGLRRVLMMGEMVTGEGMPKSIVRPFSILAVFSAAANFRR